MENALLDTILSWLGWILLGLITIVMIAGPWEWMIYTKISKKLEIISGFAAVFWFFLCLGAGLSLLNLIDRSLPSPGLMAIVCCGAALLYTGYQFGSAYVDERLFRPKA